MKLKDIEKISGKRFLVSACLLGISCRFDGRSKPNEKILKLAQKNIMISVCPETLADLPIPRNPVEILNSKVIDKQGKDYTQAFSQGAQLAFEIYEQAQIDYVILKAKSPSCGYGQIYDGTFSGKLVEGNGIFADMVAKKGKKVYSEKSFK